MRAKAEQIYDEDFADRTGPWLISIRRHRMWEKGKLVSDKITEMIATQWPGVDISKQDAVIIKP